ncbi:hypothetical protein KW850_20845 [Bacillus sp. sid0103]|uniref:hypothetical protein n=1 Tax=Bacillus sp. sid0103 TaxID=2856337 RepID=UPI001C47EB04|nr:hypothetical protein [Bacillus sp. sid0103]MBV7507681.1 hypothetical protein [Bacillus sp. sid0103]
MFNLLIFVLIAITLVLLSIFIDGLMKLYKEEMEAEKNVVRDGMEGYLDQTFGIGPVKIFKTMFDADGNVRYLIYLPQYQWFKSPKYKWYEVYATKNGFQHHEVEG